MDYNYQVIEIDLSTARLDSQFAVSGHALLIREITNVNANLAVKFDSTSAGSFPLHVGDHLNWTANGFQKIYISNDAVISGKAIIIVSTGIAIQKLLRITSDIIQEGIRQQSVTITDAGELIPAVPLTDRINMVIVNTGTDTVYIGSSTVTASGAATDGVPLNATESIVFNLNETVLIYGICAAGKSTTVNIIEGA
jgi:hypothetical protein